MCGFVTYEMILFMLVSFDQDWCVAQRGGWTGDCLMIMAMNGRRPHFNLLLGLLCGAAAVLSKLKLHRLVRIIISGGVRGGQALKSSTDVSKAIISNVAPLLFCILQLLNTVQVNITSLRVISFSSYYQPQLHYTNMFIQHPQWQGFNFHCTPRVIRYILDVIQNTYLKSRFCSW